MGPFSAYNGLRRGHEFRRLSRPAGFLWRSAGGAAARTSPESSGVDLRNARRSFWPGGSWCSYRERTRELRDGPKKACRSRVTWRLVADITQIHKLGLCCWMNYQMKSRLPHESIHCHGHSCIKPFTASTRKSGSTMAPSRDDGMPASELLRPRSRVALAPDRPSKTSMLTSFRANAYMNGNTVAHDLLGTSGAQWEMLKRSLCICCFLRAPLRCLIYTSCTLSVSEPSAAAAAPATWHHIASIFLSLVAVSSRRHPGVAAAVEVPVVVQIARHLCCYRRLHFPAAA